MVCIYLLVICDWEHMFSLCCLCLSNDTIGARGKWHVGLVYTRTSNKTCRSSFAFRPTANTKMPRSSRFAVCCWLKLNGKYTLFDIPSMKFTALLYGQQFQPTMDFSNNPEDNTIIGSRNRSGSQVKHTPQSHTHAHTTSAQWRKIHSIVRLKTIECVGRMGW